MPSTRARGEAEFEVDQELERNLRKARRGLQLSLSREGEIMAEGNQQRPRLFGDCYIPKIAEFVEPENEPAGYQVPPALINLIQNTAMFHGLDNEDPNLHLQTFMEHCGLLKCPGMPFSQLRRIMFPFSLGGKAREWYQANGKNIRTYEELTNKFVTKFFPPSKMDKLRNEVHNFKQLTGESFSECWDRFQGMVQKCPNLMVEQGYEIQIFYNGLQPETKFMVNASAGGSLKDKTYEEVRDCY